MPWLIVGQENSNEVIATSEKRTFEVPIVCHVQLHFISFYGVVVECEIALKSLLYEDFKSYYIHLIWKGALACASCNWSTRAVRLLWTHCVINLYADIKNKSNAMGK